MNSLTPDSGSARTVLTDYSLAWGLAASVRGLAIGHLWSEGAALLGSSGNTGGGDFWDSIVLVLVLDIYNTMAVCIVSH